VKRSDRTKERILQKAVEIVREKGYAATTTKEIAEAAGVSEATLFNPYFERVSGKPGREAAHSLFYDFRAGPWFG